MHAHESQESLGDADLAVGLGEVGDDRYRFGEGFGGVDGEVAAVFGHLAHSVEIGLGQVQDVEPGAGGQRHPAGFAHEGGCVADPLARRDYADYGVGRRQADEHLAADQAEHAGKAVAGVVKALAGLEGFEAAAADDFLAEQHGAAGEPAVAFHQLQRVTFVDQLLSPVARFGHCQYADSWEAAIGL